MKFLFTLALLFSFSTSFSQWTRVEQLPASNMFSIFHKGNALYAGGTNVVYISNNKGQTWDTTTAIPGLSPITSRIANIIIYKNELYAAVPGKGVFKSPDGGASWQNISAGIFPQVTGMCEYRGNLYASTEGNFASPIFKLDPVSKASWLSFSNGLSGISTVVNAIGANSNALVAGTNDNGLYDYLPGNSTTWDERFLTNPVSVSEGVFNIITAHDTLFYSGTTGKFFISTDNGLSWTVFGSRLVTGNNFMVNAKQAVISSRYIFDGVSNTTLFYYIKKDSLQLPFKNFSVVTNHFSWKIDIVGDKLWDASDGGLFFMSLSDLPGITAADDTVAIILPVRFISFNANCQSNKVIVNWKTAQEQNSSRFDIERSADGINWTVIGSQVAAGNSTIEKTYSFTDNTPLQNNFYRIGEYDLDGRVQYTDTFRSSCNATGAFSVWPNPVHDKIFISIVSGNQSIAIIKLFDSKGALVRSQKTIVLQGSNQFNIDTRSLANGVYSLSVEWNNGQENKTIKMLKQ